MEEKLKQFQGKKIDVNCGNAALFRGTVEGIENGLLILRDEDDDVTFLSIGKIIAIAECSQAATRPGFIGQK